jgi:hypothetical protein
MLHNIAHAFVGVANKRFRSSYAAPSTRFHPVGKELLVHPDEVSGARFISPLSGLSGARRPKGGVLFKRRSWFLGALEATGGPNRAAHRCSKRL